MNSDFRTRAAAAGLGKQTCQHAEDWPAVLERLLQRAVSSRPSGFPRASQRPWWTTPLPNSPACSATLYQPIPPSQCGRLFRNSTVSSLLRTGRIADQSTWRPSSRGSRRRHLPWAS